MLGCPGFGVLGVLPPLCDLICLGMAPYSTPYARLFNVYNSPVGVHQLVSHPAAYSNIKESRVINIQYYPK